MRQQVKQSPSMENKLSAAVKHNRHQSVSGWVGERDAPQRFKTGLVLKGHEDLGEESLGGFC